ncbi:MAG: SEC-C domain-containing protein [Proteobacteria bacterium]|nr:SEC-C domain-containing protein [Pseudomonadota bacterium]
MRGERHGGVPCASRPSTSTPGAFEVTRKRRKGFPSEARVMRGTRIVGGYKELLEKLGRNDPCPCGSGRRFQALLPAGRNARWVRSRLLLSGPEGGLGNR